LDSGLNPALVLDKALFVLRRASAQQWLCGLRAGLPLTAVLLCLYALRHVAGVRPPLWLFGVLGALTFWVRFHLLCGLAREWVCTLEPHAPAPPPAAMSRVFPTAMLAGIGACLWAACLVAAAQRSFVFLLACLPLLSARGAIAPSLLARAGCAPEAGWPACLRALDDTRGARQLFASVELLQLLALLVLFGNVYALIALCAFVASSLLGLDVGFVFALIAPDNELSLLLSLGLAALLLEPLRAASSAVAFQIARERHEAADLHAAIDALVADAAARDKPRASVGSVGVVLALLPHAAAAVARGVAGLIAVVLLASVPLAHAHAEPTAADAAARDAARAILQRAEFLPSSDDSGPSSFQQWLDRRARERAEADRDAGAPPRFELQLSPALVVVVACVLVLAVALWLALGMRAARRRRKAVVTASVPSSGEHLAEAARFAEQADYSAAMRSLYAACLQALGPCDPAHTNAQLSERLAPGPLRAAFERLTVGFERCSYGRQAASRAELEQAQQLAAEIVRRAAS
jgi:hypothetical protein